MFRVPRSSVLRVAPVAALLASGVYTPFAISALCIWMWLQWPRERSVTVIFLLAAFLLFLVNVPELAGRLGSWHDFGWTFQSFVRDADLTMGWLAAISTATACSIFSRLATKWRLVNHRSDEVQIDVAARTSIMDILVAMTSLAITFSILRLRVDTRDWYQTLNMIGLSAVCTCGIVLSLRVLSKPHWLVVSMRSIPLFLGIATALSTTFGLRGWNFYSSAVNRSLSKVLFSSLREAGTLALLILSFAILLRCVGITLHHNDASPSVAATRWGARTASVSKVALWVLASLGIFGMLLLNLMSPYGLVGKRSETLQFSVQGWPMPYKATQWDPIIQLDALVFWRSTALVADLAFALIIALLLGGLGPWAIWQTASVLKAKKENESSAVDEPSGRLRRSVRWAAVALFFTIPLSFLGWGCLRVIEMKRVEQNARQVGDLVGDQQGNGWITKAELRDPLIDQFLLLLENQLFRNGSVHRSQVIGVSCAQPDPALMSEICRLPWLRHLYLEGGKILGDDLQSLVDHNRLTVLNAVKTELPPETADQLIAMPTMARLRMDQVPGATPKASRRQSNLKHLMIRLAKQDQNFPFPRSLETLDLTVLDDLSTLAIDNLPNLQILDFSSHSKHLSVNIDHCPKLQSVMGQVDSESLSISTNHTPLLESVAIYLDRQVAEDQEVHLPAPRISIECKSCRSELSLESRRCTLEKVLLPSGSSMLSVSLNAPEATVSRDWALSQLELFPKHSLHSVDIQDAPMDSRTLTLLGERHRDIQHVSLWYCKFDASFNIDLAWNVKSFWATNWNPSNDEIDDFLKRSPNLEQLTVSGENLDCIDLSKNPSLHDLVIRGSKGLEQLDLGESSLTNLQIAGTRKLLSPSRISTPGLQIFGKAFDRESLVTLLDRSFTSISIGTIDMRPDDWMDLDFRACQNLAVWDPSLSIDAVKTWKLDTDSGDSSLKAFSLGLPEPLDVTLSEILNIHPDLSELQLDLTAYHNQPTAKETVNVLVYLDATYFIRLVGESRYPLTVSLRGRAIDAKIIRQLNRISTPAIFDLRNCVIDDSAVQAIAKFENRHRLFLGQTASVDWAALAKVSKENTRITIDLSDEAQLGWMSAGLTYELDRTESFSQPVVYPKKER